MFDELDKGTLNMVQSSNLVKSRLKFPTKEQLHVV